MPNDFLSPQVRILWNNDPSGRIGNKHLMQGSQVNACSCRCCLLSNPSLDCRRCRTSCPYHLLLAVWCSEHPGLWALMQKEQLHEGLRVQNLHKHQILLNCWVQTLLRRDCWHKLGVQTQIPHFLILGVGEGPSKQTLEHRSPESRYQIAGEL